MERERSEAATAVTCVHIVAWHSGYATFYSTVYERMYVRHGYAHIHIRTRPRCCVLAHMLIASIMLAQICVSAFRAPCRSHVCFVIL